MMTPNTALKPAPTTMTRDPRIALSKPLARSNGKPLKMVKKRKAAKAGKKEEQAPVFLKKCYHMIDACEPDIATWSEAGDSFVVKDPEKFSSNVIPNYYKHNNFSSFIRQLNFYGFRKIKNDPIRIDPALEEIESKYWRFRHDKFLRGRPDLLTEIKKANHTTPDKEEVDALKKEVKELKERISNMSSDIDRLTSLVETVVMNQPPLGPSHVQESHNDPSASENPSKKRKLNHNENALADDVTSMPLEYTPGSVRPAEPQENRAESYSTIQAIEEAFDDGLFTDLGIDDAIIKSEEDTMVPDQVSSTQAASSPMTETSAETALSVKPELVKKLHDSLALLPPQLQEAFIERLVATITAPECFHNHVDAITSLAEEAADQAEGRMVRTDANSNSVSPNCHVRDPKIALPLAAATLGAYLNQYGKALQAHNCVVDSRAFVVPEE